MTLKPGDPWGRRGVVSLDTPVVTTDRDLARMVDDGARVVALDGGDLWRTLGGRGGVAQRLGVETTILDVDVASVTADGAPLGSAVAHVVARGRAWSGRGFIAMNAEWMGEWDVAPRSHPGDGRLDVIEGRLDLRQRLLARRRVRTADHLPHPELTVRRLPSAQAHFERPRRLWLDSQAVGTCTRLEISLDASVTVVV